VTKIKILLNVFSTEIREQDFNKLSEVFVEEDYLVFNFRYPLSGYYLDMIDTFINYLSVEHNINVYNAKVVLQSNIGNLLFAWYRLYNDVIDDFVLVDRSLVFFQSKDTAERNIVEQLSNFSAIEQDRCKGPIFYRYDQVINQELLKLFMESNQLNLLRSFRDLDLDIVCEKRQVSKGYKYKDLFYKRVIAKDMVDFFVDLNQQRIIHNEIYINKTTHPSGYFFAFLYILNLPIPYIEKVKFASGINQQITEEVKQKVTAYILNYLDSAEEILPFKQVINLYSFLIMMGADKTIIKKILKYIRKDSNNFDDYYAPFTNVLFYITKANQMEYEEYFLDRREIMRKLREYYKPMLKINANRTDNHLVIVSGQLLNYLHAPSKLVIDYANHLLKHYPKLKIKIVVEDMFNYSPNELFFVYPFCSIDSRTQREEHQRLLHPSIEVYYSNSNLSRIERLQNDIKAITDFKPQWILKIGAPESLAVDQLYDFYPISSFSMGGAEYSEWVDVKFGGYALEKINQELCTKGIKDNKYIYEHHYVGLNFAEIKNKFSREELNFSSKDFILVTVGNRLEADLTREFIEGMYETLKKHESLRWIIIGSASNALVNEICSDLITVNKIQFITYTDELLSYYNISDVYVNPFRKGGGLSIAQAMYMELPIIALNEDTDAIPYVTAAETFKRKDFFTAIQKLYLDKDFYKRKSEFSRKRIQESYSFEAATKHLIDILLRSEKIFSERHK